MSQERRDRCRSNEPIRTWSIVEQNPRDQNRNAALQRIEQERKNTRRFARASRNIRRPSSTRTRLPNIITALVTHDQVAKRNRTDQVCNNDDEQWSQQEFTP
jgi:hypothetical protein